MTPAPTPRETEDARTQLERDLYRDLLQLGRQREVRTFLADALKKIVALTGAERGYIELGSEDSTGAVRQWFVAHGCEVADVEVIQRRVSRGIIAEAMSSGETILSQSALLDERFSARESVKAAGLEAVLCVPIVREEPFGVVYLEGQAPFTQDDKGIVELFCEHLAPLAENVVLRAIHSHEVTLPEEVVRLIGSTGFVSVGPAMIDTLRTAATVAPLDVHVLLTGDSGTGKTQLARMIHNASARRAAPFVEVNCATLQQSLVENELFGAAPGAHSTATKAIEGKIASARGGTLFLDEISELSLDAQPKLLQFLHSKQYYPLGSSTPHHADVRIIAATNLDLRKAVAERRFREDLMWRLLVLPIRLPSLAERSQDLDMLVEHFCSRIPLRHGFARLPLSPAALRAIRAAEWPGNVRQLEHALEAGAIRAAGQRANVIGVSHVFPERAEASECETLTFQEATREFQAELLRSTLVATDWNVSECARRLDVARSHVYNLIQAFGISRARS